MEEDTQASIGEQEKLLDTKIEEIKKEVDENALENEFIKVEMVPVDVKENSATPKSTTVVKEQSCSAEVNLNGLEHNNELMKAQQIIKQLEIKVDTLCEELQCAESEGAKFQAELSAANERLQLSEKQCKQLENDLRRLKEEMVESGLKHQSQLESLQKAFQAQEKKHEELLRGKEAFDGLQSELESSRKKVEKLEEDLFSSTDEVRRLEALRSKRDICADLETKKASELEKMLEVSKFNAKEMENQMGLLQEELKGLYEKVTHNKLTEEAFNKTKLELSMVYEELELSRLQVSELEQKVASEEAAILDLTQELKWQKASEKLLREDMKSIEISLSASREDLQTKTDILKENEMKLQKVLAERETLGADLQVLESQVLNLQEELNVASKEKEKLETTIGELNVNLLEFKKKYADIDNKLILSNQKFIKTDSLLSETLSLNAYLQEKVRSLEESLKESGVTAEILSQRNTELEDLIKESNAALEDVKAQIRNMETMLVSVEQRNSELEKEHNVAELNYRDKDMEISELQGKASELSSLLKASQEENATSQCHIQAHQDRTNQLESSLETSVSRNTKLEMELKELVQKCGEHESRSASVHETNIELEKLIQLAHSKAENSGNRVGELEHLLENMKRRVMELEEQLSTSQLEQKNIEAELEHKSFQVSVLCAELEAFRVKSSSLESAMDAANNKEIELLDMLNEVHNEKKKFEDLSINSGDKLLEAENLVNTLQVDLSTTKEKLQNVLEDLEVSRVREKEILKKFKYAEERLEHQEREVASDNARSLKLELLHEALSKETEMKLKEATQSSTQKDLVAKELKEKLKSLDKETTLYKERAVEASSQLASSKAELEVSSNKLSSLESTVEELKTKLLEAEERSKESFKHNQLLIEINMKLKEELEEHQHKINDLHESLSSVYAEKDSTAEQLVVYVKALAELRDEHLKVVELHSAVECSNKEREAQLSEAIDRLRERDSEVKGLSDKISDHESQEKIYEEQLWEAAASAEAQMAELDETLSKLSILERVFEEEKCKTNQVESEKESLLQVNMKLKEELEEHRHNINDLHERLSSIYAEKDSTAEQLAVHVKTLAELRDEHLKVVKLHSVSEFNKKEREAQLDETFATLRQRDSEVKGLNDKLGDIESQVNLYEEQLRQAAASIETQTAELDDTLSKLRTLERVFEEEKCKTNQVESEKESLLQANMKLQEELKEHHHKINDLHERLSFVCSEKDSTAEQLAVHVKTLTELRGEHLKVEAQLSEAFETLRQRDSEVKGLNDKLRDFESQVNLYEEQLQKVAASAEAQTTELDETLSKLSILGRVFEEEKYKKNQLESANKSLLQENVKLKEELEADELKINDLHESLTSVRTEKDSTAEKLAYHVKSLAELRDEHLKVVELHSEAESIKKEREVQLSEAIEKLTQRDYEAEKLRDKLNDLESQVKLYEERLHEAAASEEAWRSELDETLSKLSISETILGEEKCKINQLEYANESLLQENVKLKEELEANELKINDLHERLTSVHTEKDSTAEKLAYHVKSLAELRDEHLKVVELHSEAEAIKKEREVQLSEAFEKLTQRDYEAEQLRDKLNDLESQVKLYEGRLHEAVASEEAWRSELDETLSKLNISKGILGEEKCKTNQLESANESLLQVNMKLKEELEAHQGKIGDLHEHLISVQAEKDLTAEQLSFHVKALSDLRDEHMKVMELHSEVKSSKEETETQLNEAFEKLTHRDSENKALRDKLYHLEKQLELYEEQLREAAAATEDQTADLDRTISKLSNLEMVLEEEKGKVSQLESVKESLLLANMDLKEELEAHQHKIIDLHERLSSVQLENDLTAEKLTLHVKSLAELRDEHFKVVELHSEAESSKMEIENRLSEALEKLTQRDYEAKGLREKLNHLESQVKSYEGQLHDAAAFVEARTVELDGALSQLSILERTIEEGKDKIHHLESSNEFLAETNMKLNQEMFENKTKINDLLEKFYMIVAEKEDAFGEIHLLREENENMVQMLSSEGDVLHSQIATLLGEKNMLNQMYIESRKEIEAANFQMEEQLNLHKSKEISLIENLEMLKAERKFRSEIQMEATELEQKLLSSDIHFREEIESIRAASDAKEAELMSKLEEHATELREKVVLHEQLEQLQRQFNLAHTTIAKQENERTKLAFVNEELRKKIVTLENKLHVACDKSEKYKEENVESEGRDQVVVKSRDIDFSITTPSKRKSKNETGKLYPSSLEAVENPVMEPTGAMAFKFFLGVALVSMLIGIILGKRY